MVGLYEEDDWQLRRALRESAAATADDTNSTTDDTHPADDRELRPQLPDRLHPAASA